MLWQDNNLRGETLPTQQQVYRVIVVTALLRAGIPPPKLGTFTKKMPTVLTDCRHMFNRVQFILKEQEARI